MNDEQTIITHCLKSYGIRSSDNRHTILSTKHLFRKHLQHAKQTQYHFWKVLNIYMAEKVHTSMPYL